MRSQKILSSLVALGEQNAATFGIPLFIIHITKMKCANARAEQTLGWQPPDSGTVVWLEQLADDRWTIGSAQASAWLQAATSTEPLNEVIVLPSEMELRSTAQHSVRNRNSQTPLILEAYPNPSEGPVYVVCNVPEGVTQAVLRISDMNGRLIQDMPLQAGTGLAEIRQNAVAAGIYLAELRLDDIRVGQVKLALR